MERAINLLHLDLESIPVIRLANGRYLLGTEQKMIVLKNSSCMVRVGGGFEKLEDYMEKHKDTEMDKIRRMMSDGPKSYHQVLIELLTKYGAE